MKTSLIYEPKTTKEEGGAHSVSLKSEPPAAWGQSWAEGEAKEDWHVFFSCCRFDSSCYFRQHQLSHIGILKTYYCCCCRCLDHDEEQVEASDAKAPLENFYPSAWGCDKKLLISRINLWSFLISFSSVNCGNKCRWLCHKGKMKSAHRRLTGIANITPDPWINVLLSHLDQLLLRHVCGAALSGLL